MNTAVVETEEEDNTSNVAAGRAARGLAPEHPGDARPSGACGRGAAYGSATRGAAYGRRVYEREAGGAEGKTRARELWSRGLTGYISWEFFIFFISLSHWVTYELWASFFLLALEARKDSFWVFAWRRMFGLVANFAALIFSHNFPVC